MIRGIFLTIIVSVMLCQCSNDKHTSIIREFPIQAIGNAEEIHVEPVLFIVEALELTESGFLVAIGSEKDKLFHVFNTPTCSYLGYFGNIGRGPEEYSSIYTNTVGAEEDHLYFVDNNIYKKIEIAYDNNSLTTSMVEKTILPGKVIAVNGIVPLKENNYIGVTSNNFIKDEFFFFNAEKNSLKGLGKYPNLIESANIKAFSNFQLYVKNLYPKPDGSRFAVLYSNFKYMRIFDKNVKLIGSIQISSKNKQKITINPEGTINTSDSYTYYLEGAVTEKYIYGLNIERKPDEIPIDPDANFSTYLHVWDWNGNPVAEITLPNTDFKIAIDKDDRYLYTVNPYKKDVIFRYDLDDLLTIKK